MARAILELQIGRVGHKHTDESKLKLSKAHLGKKMPPVKLETRVKLSLAVASSWAKRKQLKKGV